MRYFASILCLLLPHLFGETSGVRHLVYEEMQGVDISRYQRRINWDTVKARENIDFVFIKATEGRDYIDSSFCHNWEELRRTGMRRGAYHFFRSYGCGDEQASHFLSTVEMLPGDLVPVLDIETTDGMSEAVIAQEADIWLKTVEQRLKVKPIIYTNQFFYDRYLSGRFDEYPLWVARYSGQMPVMKNSKAWHIWQYSNNGVVRGIPARVDMNLFFGTPEMLERLCWFPPAPAPTEERIWVAP
jgi:lysozyme